MSLKNPVTPPGIDRGTARLWRNALTTTPLQAPLLLLLLLLYYVTPVVSVFVIVVIFYALPCSVHTNVFRLGLHELLELQEILELRVLITKLSRFKDL